MRESYYNVRLLLYGELTISNLETNNSAVAN